MLKCVLVHEKTNKPAVVGEDLKDFRGDPCVLKSWSLPYDADPEFLKTYTGDVADLNLNRGGKIYCEEPGHSYQSQWYPSVCGLRFVVVNVE